MKQPEDVKTLELPIDVKRGRGRPPKVDALTQAERARLYRARVRSGQKVFTKNISLEVETLNKKTSTDFAFNELMRLERALEDSKRDALQQKKRVDALQRENDLLISERAAAWAEIERLKRDASR